MGSTIIAGSSRRRVHLQLLLMSMWARYASTEYGILHTYLYTYVPYGVPRCTKVFRVPGPLRFLRHVGPAAGLLNFLRCNLQAVPWFSAGGVRDGPLVYLRLHFHAHLRSPHRWIFGMEEYMTIRIPYRERGRPCSSTVPVRGTL